MLAHDAEFRARIEHEFRCTVVAAYQIAAITEKHEAAVHQPAHEISHLDQLAHRRGLLADLQRAAGHLVEIVGRLMYFAKNRDYIALDFARLRGRRRELELRVNERLAALGRRRLLERRDPPFPVARHLEDGMKHRAHGRAEMMEIFEQAVDDERAVAGSVRTEKNSNADCTSASRRLAGTRSSWSAAARANSRAANAATMGA